MADAAKRKYWRKYKWHPKYVKKLRQPVVLDESEAIETYKRKRNVRATARLLGVHMEYVRQVLIKHNINTNLYGKMLDK